MSVQRSNGLRYRSEHSAYFARLGRLDRRLADTALMMIRRRRGKLVRACARA